MRTLGKWLLRLAVLVLALGLFLWLGPRDEMTRPASFEPVPEIGALQDWLATAEAQVPNLRPGSAKQIVWAGAPGQQTDIAVVYLHGFSADREEVRPLPDRVAAGLGANLFLTRLTGHGRDGAAMSEATAEDWLRDTAEALAIGRRLGRQVLVMGTSTGGTLAAWAATDPELAQGMLGQVLISPNFGVRNPAAKILDLPLAPIWGPWVAGAERSFEPQNPGHARHWTTAYSTSALFPMATLVRDTMKQDFASATMPALFIFSDEDKVVDPALARAVAGRWGGPVTIELQFPGPDADSYNHVLAGDILSPGRTDPMAATILAWVAAQR